MKNKEKFLAIVSAEKYNAVEINRERIKNRAMLRESQQIAMKVLSKLDELGWSQKRLADEMQVTPQYVSKILKGRENLTIETQIALQQILDVPVLASYYEIPDSARKTNSVVVYTHIDANAQNADIQDRSNMHQYGAAKTYEMMYHTPSGNYSYNKVA